jgi:hypothetical protein
MRNATSTAEPGITSKHTRLPRVWYAEQSTLERDPIGNLLDPWTMNQDRFRETGTTGSQYTMHEEEHAPTPAAAR